MDHQRPCIGGNGNRHHFPVNAYQLAFSKLVSVFFDQIIQWPQAVFACSGDKGWHWKRLPDAPRSLSGFSGSGATLRRIKVKFGIDIAALLHFLGNSPPDRIIRQSAFPIRTLFGVQARCMCWELHRSGDYNNQQTAANACSKRLLCHHSRLLNHKTHGLLTFYSQFMPNQLLSISSHNLLYPAL